MIDFQVARDKLAQFQTADEIAEYLKDEGIEGHRFVSDRCPIAVWMRVQTKVTVSVGATQLVKGDGTEGARETALTSPAMEKFINRFDGGDYPELDVDFPYFNYGY